MESQTLGLCLALKTSSDNVGVANCYENVTKFSKIPISLDTFLLKSTMSVLNQCLYASSSENGAQIKTKTCNDNDPTQYFYFEDY
jgi:hypothetical protein